MQRNGTAGVSWHEKLVVAKKAVEASAGSKSQSERRPQLGVTTGASPRRGRRADFGSAADADGAGEWMAETFALWPIVRIAPKAHKAENNQKAHSQSAACEPSARRGSIRNG